APYSGSTVMLGYFCINAAIAASVASCLASPPHQLNLSVTLPSPESPLPPLSEEPEPEPEPQAVKDNAITDASVKANAFFNVFFIFPLPFFFFLAFLCTLIRNLCRLQRFAS